jgi:hypothetical protein
MHVTGFEPIELEARVFDQFLDRAVKVTTAA